MKSDQFYMYGLGGVEQQTCPRVAQCPSVEHTPGKGIKAAVVDWDPGAEEGRAEDELVTMRATHAFKKPPPSWKLKAETKDGVRAWCSWCRKFIPGTGEGV